MINVKKHLLTPEVRDNLVAVSIKIFDFANTSFHSKTNKKKWSLNG
jgi:solute carrier family 25 (mitochondrial aspartate/glutamate transporter), member 12/13